MRLRLYERSLAIAIVVAVLTSALIIVSTPVMVTSIEKGQLHSKIILAITNGASLDDIKQLLINSSKKNKKAIS